MAEGIKVWVFNHFASTPETNTGAGERHYFLAKEFEKSKCATTVFSASYNHLFLNQPRRTFPYNIQIFGDNIRYVWVWVTKYNPSSGVGRFINWLSFVATLFLIPKRKFGKPDVIIVSSMSMWPILNALWYRLWHPSVKVIFEIRDVWPLTPIEIGGMSPRNPVIRLMFKLERWAYKKSDCIVSVLPKASDRVKEVLGERPFYFEWIPNAMNGFAGERAEYIKPTSKEKLIMYAGAIGPANSLDMLVGIAEILKDDNFKFILFGDGPERLRLEQIVTKKELDNVYFKGKVNKEDVQNQLAQADALFVAWHNISIYRYGVSANKYNDYMSLAKPIISVGNIAYDPVELAQCGIVIKERSAETCARNILKLFELSEDRLKEMGNNGYKYWKENKTYSVISESYLKIFNKLSNE